MTVNLTRVAYGATSLDQLARWLATQPGIARLTTRYKPKRHAELVGGSLYWIIKHTLVARCPIVGFAETDEGRTDILLTNTLFRVRPIARRAHQGWRYLEVADAPPDLGEGSPEGELPAVLAGKLASMGLI